MKKFFKLFLIILGIIAIIFAALITFTVVFFSGESNFNEDIEGLWTTTQLEKPINFRIYKGSREVQGYTYGYFDAVNFDKYSYHIRYKDKSLEFVENDKEQFLKYLPDTDILKGKIYLPNTSVEKLETVILEKTGD